VEARVAHVQRAVAPLLFPRAAASPLPCLPAAVVVARACVQDCEDGIPLDYLSGLDTCYGNFLRAMSETGAHVLSVPWSAFGDAAVVAGALQDLPASAGDWSADMRRIMFLCVRGVPAPAYEPGVPCYAARGRLGVAGGVLAHAFRAPGVARGLPVPRWLASGADLPAFLHPRPVCLPALPFSGLRACRRAASHALSLFRPPLLCLRRPAQAGQPIRGAGCHALARRV
jgi:hypothetical protein